MRVKNDMAIRRVIKITKPSLSIIVFYDSNFQVGSIWVNLGGVCIAN